jgi:uncharacterized membrane protein YphA (DoxX/SURF4 family)
MYRLVSLANDPLFRFRYGIHKIVDKPTSFREYVLERTDCAPMRDALNGGSPWDSMYALSQNMMNECPETYLFLRGEDTSLITWTLDKPFAAGQQFFDVMHSIVIPIYTPGRALPAFTDSWLMPQWPVWILLSISLVVGALLALPVGARFRITMFSAVAVVIVALSSIAFAYAVWASDGIEHDRHLMPMTILAIVSALVFPAVLAASSRFDSADNPRSEVAPTRH